MNCCPNKTSVSCINEFTQGKRSNALWFTHNLVPNFGTVTLPPRVHSLINVGLVQSESIFQGKLTQAFHHSVSVRQYLSSTACIKKVTQSKQSKATKIISRYWVNSRIHPRVYSLCMPVQKNRQSSLWSGRDYPAIRSFDYLNWIKENHRTWTWPLPLAPKPIMYKFQHAPRAYRLTCALTVHPSPPPPLHWPSPKLSWQAATSRIA